MADDRNKNNKGKKAEPVVVDMSSASKSIDKLHKQIKKISFTVGKDTDDLFKDLDKKVDTLNKKLDETSKKVKAINVTSSNGTTSIATARAGGSREQAKSNRELSSRMISEYKEAQELSKLTKSARTKAGAEYYSKISSLSSGLTNSRKVLSSAIESGASSKIIKSLTNNVLKQEDALNSLKEQGVPAIEEAAEETTKSVKSSLKKLDETIQKFIKDFFNKYNEAYNQTYTTIAGRTGSGNSDSRSDTRQYYRDVNNYLNSLGSSVQGAVSVSKDVLPKMAEMSAFGLKGDNLVAASINATVDSKIMPWLIEASETWVNLSSNLSSYQLKSLKSQQLVLQESESGNRLLNTGVINSLYNELEPILSNIDYNTGGANNMSAEYTAMMESMVDAGYSTDQAYKKVQEYVRADQNLYGALTNGNAETKLYAMSRANGEDVFDSSSYSTEYLSDMAGSSSDNVGASAVFSILGGLMTDWATKDQANRQSKIWDDKSGYTKYYNDIINATEDEYDAAVESSNNYVTAQQSFGNHVDNFGKSVKLFATAGLIIPIANGVMNAVSSLAGSETIAKLGKQLLSKTALSKIFKSLGSSTASEVASSTLGSTVGSAAGGAVSGGAAAGGLSALAANTIGLAGSVVGIAGGIYYAYRSLRDAYQMTQRADELGVSKTSAGVSGFLFGNSSDTHHTAKQVGKYGGLGAGIGALIGTFVGGPVGTAIGAGIGGVIGSGIGALSTYINGDSFAKILDTSGKTLKKTVSKFFKNVSGVFDSADPNSGESSESWWSRFKSRFFSNAIGIDNVPYDGYLAKLHKGEAVLTKTDAEAYRSSDAESIVAKAVEADKNLYKSLTSADTATKMYNAMATNNAKTEASDTEFHKQVIDAIADAASMIVNSIQNMSGNSENSSITNTKNLLQNVMNRNINQEMINLSASSAFSLSNII